MAEQAIEDAETAFPVLSTLPIWQSLRRSGVSTPKEADGLTLL